MIAVDVREEKLGIAKQFGASDTVNPKSQDPVKTILGMTNEIGVDLALDCAGSPIAMDQAIRSTAMGGRTVNVGVFWEKIPIDLRALMVNESLVTASCDHTRNDQRTVIGLVASGRIDLAKSITHRIRFEQINEGIDILDEKKGNPIRIVAEQ